MIPVIGVGLIALLLSALPARAATAPSDELKALRGKLETLKRDIARSEGSRSEAADALKSSEQAISEANRRLSELSASQKEADARLESLQQQRAALEARLRKQQALAARLLYLQYTGPRAGTLQALASGQNPNEVARTGVYLEYVARARKAVLDELRRDVAALQVLAEESTQRRQELTAIQDQQIAERKRLDQQRKERQQLLASVSAQIDRQRREAGALERDEKRLTKLVEDLAKMLAARKTKPKAVEPRPPSKAEAKPEPSPEPIARGAPGPAALEQHKGKLYLPVRGELTGRFGSPRSDSGLTWRGLFFQAPAGREVKAVASGRVVFADWLRGFGNLLILDHGDGFMSLYGNNEALIGRLGDAVRGGDTVATVGSSGGNTATGLYFELRHQGKPFDPLGWLNLK